MTKLKPNPPAAPAPGSKSGSNSDFGGLDVFYPIVPDVGWVARIVPKGVRTVQLRVKDASLNDVRDNIKEALFVCAAHGCQLIVNDYWREAIELGADFIHLGQEDLLNADVRAIKAHGLRLGISTHSEAELAVSLSVQPDYVALGPVYETKLKAMAFAPQGLTRVTRWSELAGTVPVVGIGGITVERASGVIEAGARSVCAITDFVASDEPDVRIKEWLSWARLHRTGSGPDTDTDQQDD